ncbi:MAG: ligase-associated DNA damage response endonuclease PdeM, partial [Eudoraea sp.]|nr:ligase-associated DNA damage response endonuclease PdeM [Eudoraea sp.]
MIKHITLRGQTFALHSSGVIYWQAKDMLLISDVHLGKITHFRKHGSAVPLNAIHGNFRLLNTAVERFNPKTICFLGDLFHSYKNSEWEYFESWVINTGIVCLLISGNHDILPESLFEKLNMEVWPELVIDDFLLTHHPTERTPYFNISGHIHPAVRLKGTARQSLRLPCFFRSGDQLIMPAFGEFTGSHT